MTKKNCIECKNKLKEENQLLCHNCGKVPEKIDFFELIEEMKKNTVKLNKKIITLRALVRSFNYNKWDVRLNLLDDLGQLFGWLNWQLNFHLTFSKDKDGSIPSKIRKENPKMKDVDISRIIINYDIINRRVFFTEFMFRVEHLMKRINEILAHPTKEDSYYPVVVHILKNLRISETEDEHYRTLVFPSFVRNSLHLNGEHTRGNKKGSIKGINFEFKKGKTIDFYGWRHLYFFCDCILDELPVILNSKLINKKPIILEGPHKRFWEITSKIKDGRGIRIPPGIQIFDQEGNEI